MLNRKSSGFTLAELLIALAILGVIATFTIPKILSATGSGQNTSIGKEAASMVSGAFSTYGMDNTVTAASTTAGLFTGYMNYVRTTTIDGGGGNALACSSGTACLVLHNGAFIKYIAAQSLAAVNGTNYWTFNVDPDGANTAAPGGTFVLYGNGRLTSGQFATGTAGTGGPTLYTTDPSWLTW